MSADYKMRKFYLEGDKVPVNGFTDGHTWNGWECPRFTREAIDTYLKANNWDYEWTGALSDVLVIHFEGSDDEVYSPEGPSELYTPEGLTWVMTEEDKLLG